MNLRSKLICATTLIAGIIYSSHAQINLLADDINFRDENNANHTTYHYGDIVISGGANGESWGWLWANRLTSAGELIGYSNASISGTATIYGNLQVYGTKNFLQPHPTDSTKLIKYVAVESSEALTITRGLAKTVNGISTINLPEHFKLVTSNVAPITVIITPENAPALLYTKEKSNERIIIRMKESDYFEYGDVSFSFQVTGVREGFENEEVIVSIDNTKNGQENISEKRAAYNEKVKNLAKKIKGENQKK